MVPTLSRSTSSGWKGKPRLLDTDRFHEAETDDTRALTETKLDGYDVSFALPPQDQSRPGSSFKVLLLSSEESKTATAKARIERLSMLDGGRNVAVILLMPNDGCVDALVNLQMR